MHFIIILLVGWLVSFLGQLPLGTMSITSTQIAVEENFYKCMAIFYWCGHSRNNLFKICIIGCGLDNATSLILYNARLAYGFVFCHSCSA